MICNIDVRNHAKLSGVMLWQVADALNISEPSITRKLRHELPEQEKAEIFAIIDRIAAENQKKG